jgi:hypothetical protein
LGVFLEVVLVELLGLFLHLKGEYLDETAEVLENQVRDDLQDIFDYFDKFI